MKSICFQCGDFYPVEEVINQLCHWCRISNRLDTSEGVGETSQLLPDKKNINTQSGGSRYLDSLDTNPDAHHGELNDPPHKPCISF